MTEQIRVERTLMRVFIAESDRCAAGDHKGRPLYEALLLFFRERGFAGAMIIKSTASLAKIRIPTRTPAALGRQNHASAPAREAETIRWAGSGAGMPSQV